MSHSNLLANLRPSTPQNASFLSNLDEKVIQETDTPCQGDPEDQLNPEFDLFLRNMKTIDTDGNLPEFGAKKSL